MNTLRFCRVLMLYPIFAADSFWSFVEILQTASRVTLNAQPEAA
jgi:hypothetical protein